MVSGTLAKDSHLSSPRYSRSGSHAGSLSIVAHSVGDDDRLVALERLQHPKGHAPLLALDQPLEEVRPVPEPGGAHDAQATADVVDGEDLHPGQRVGLQHLLGQRVECRRQRSLGRQFRRHPREGGDAAPAMSFVGDVTERDREVGVAGQPVRAVGELPGHPRGPRPRRHLFTRAVHEQPDRFGAVRARQGEGCRGAHEVGLVLPAQPCAGPVDLGEPPLGVDQREPVGSVVDEAAPSGV
jgi:hypothetical protein